MALEPSRISPDGVVTGLSPTDVARLGQLEPSKKSGEGSAAGLTAANLRVLAAVPILLEVGDYDAPRIASLKKFARSVGDNVSVMVLPEEKIFGNGHVVMIEKNNLQVADLIIQRLEKMVPNSIP